MIKPGIAVLSTLMMAAVVDVASSAPPRAPIGCEAAGEIPVTISLRAPKGVNLAGVKITLDYPEGRVGIPGFQNAPEVQARVTDVPKEFLMAPNDTDGSLIVALAGVTGLPAGQIFKIHFDRCQGSPPVGAADFHCKVDEASDAQAQLVAGTTCAVAIPTAQAD